MEDIDFINHEEAFKNELRNFIKACIEYGVDVRDRVLDCVHDEFIENDLDGISEIT